MARLTRASLAGLLVMGLLAGPSAIAGSSDFRVEKPAKRHSHAIGARANDDLSRAYAKGAISRAEYTLERARSFYRLKDVRARYGHVVKPGPRDLTMVLRDLAFLRDDLSPAQQEEAGRFFLRPTDVKGDGYGSPYTGPSQSHCTGDFCVHWATAANDPNLPDPTDIDANGRPDFVDTAITTMLETWQTEIDEVGFKAPKSDASSSNKGPDGTLDLYLADIGDDGVFGYCTTDDPNSQGGNYQFFDMSSYCVVDEDMHPDEFPNGTPVGNLQVTIAHEFFHAVQFAYDAMEDTWMMEGTAAWMEDVVYDDVNDNYNYLHQSPLLQPHLNLDYWHPEDENANLAQYGTWIFWRFMGEYLSGTGSHDPSVVLDVWNYADDSSLPGAQMQYSVQAVESVANDHGMSFGELFGTFGLLNLFSEFVYEEGPEFTEFLVDQGAPTGPALRKVMTLSSSKRKASQKFKSYQLTNSYFAFVPGNGVKSNAQLQVSFKLPPTSRGSVASYAVLFNDGTVQDGLANLKGNGKGNVKVPFSPSDVQGVYVVVTNASTNYKCWKQTVFACQGAPLDDNLSYKFTGKLKQ